MTTETENKELKKLLEFVLTEPSGDLDFIRWKLLKELNALYDEPRRED